MAGRVLILGDDPRSCLSIVRSLGRQGVSVTLGVQEPGSLAARSRYARETIIFPNSADHLEEWTNQLIGLLTDRKFDLVIPSSDNSLVPIIRRRSELEALAKFAIPDDNGFQYTHQKRLTLRLAEELKVPTPPTRIALDIGDLDMIEQDPDMNYPLIVKPDSSRAWKHGRGVDLKVRLAHNEAELLELCSAIWAAGPALIQGYFQGVGVGQEFLAENGTILRAFQHQRLHEPMSGGGSSYRKSVDLDPQMLACSERMLAHLNWTGVAMVEYKVCPNTGAFVLMEINGRFWGSLPLCLAAGADFPWDLYQVMVYGQVPTDTSYRVGVRSRNLLPDLNWFRRNWSAPRLDPYSNSISIKQATRDLARLVNPTEHLDTITLDDPLPGLIEVGRLAPMALHYATGMARKQYLRLVARSGKLRSRQSEVLTKLFADRHELVFVCKGNICRSPFAELYARKMLDEAGINSSTISSFGTFPEDDRPAPETAQLIGKEFGVDLSRHRSRFLTENVAACSGVLLCTDYQNYSRLLARFPYLAGRLLFLKPFGGASSDFEIQDPWNQSAEVFRSSFSQIAASVDEILRLVVQP